MIHTFSEFRSGNLILCLGFGFSRRRGVQGFYHEDHEGHEEKGSRVRGSIWNSARRVATPRKNGGVTFPRQAAKSAKGKQFK